MAQQSGLAQDMFGWVGQWFGNRKQQKAARGNEIRTDNLIRQTDWEPQYASQSAPTFRKAQSPVARSYLARSFTPSFHCQGDSARLVKGHRPS